MRALVSPFANSAELAALFEREDDFKRVFPETPEQGLSENIHLPMRGLREMHRFGGLKTLGSIFSQRKITTRDVDNYLSSATDQRETERENNNMKNSAPTEYLRKKI